MLTPEEFAANLPKFNDWMTALLADSAPKATPVIDARFPRLGQYFSYQAISPVKYVVVAALPLPPTEQWGLPLKWPAGLRGITFTDTYFVLPSAERDESVHFHEMIHTAQWIALGWEAFVKVYGFHQMGYADDDVSQLKGYFENPLERQALCHQRHFDLGIPNPYLADQAVKAEIPRMLNFAP